jgi:hypothetical protein
MNIEPVDVDHDAEKRLNDADNQHCDIRAASPEAPAQSRDDGTRHDENQEKAEDVIPESDIAAADRSRRKKMSEESNDKENYAEPNPERFHLVDDSVR